MNDDVVRFIRKNGRVIPIRASQGTGKLAARAAKVGVASSHATGALTAGAAAYAAHQGGRKPTGIKVNRGLDLTGLGISVASGALAAATFATPKGFAAGHLAAHALDAAGISANLASVAGKGKLKERTQQAAKQETRNFIVGNAVYAAGVFGFKKNREAAAQYAVKGAQYAKKILSFGRKALRFV